MTAILMSALFAASGLLAAITIAANWRRYGRTALALRDQMGSCSEWREVRVTIGEVTVRHQASVLRPDFTRPSRRPAGLSALPAAA
jgi:hypothetical protein